MEKSLHLPGQDCKEEQKLFGLYLRGTVALKHGNCSNGTLPVQNHATKNQLEDRDIILIHQQNLKELR